MPYLYVNKLIMLCERMSHDKSFLQKFHFDNLIQFCVHSRRFSKEMWQNIECVAFYIIDFQAQVFPAESVKFSFWWKYE